jgi:hypothetical protein
MNGETPEIVNYLPGYWRVDLNGQTIGWVNLDNPSGKYIARKQRTGPAHIGGVSPIFGEFDSLEDAANSLPGPTTASSTTSS